MANRWLEHVKEFRKKNPNLSYKEVLKRAKKDYKKEDSKKPKAKSKAKASKPKSKKENVELSIRERKIERDKLFRDAQLEREKDEERKSEAQRKGIKKETLDLVDLLKGGNLAGGAIIDPKELFSTKAERSKLVRKYTEFKKAVQEGLRKGVLSQRDFNNFMGLTRILQKTKNDKYAKDYKKISKEFKSKKYAKLKDRSSETLTAKSKKQLVNLTRIMEKDVLFKGAQNSRAKAEDKLEQRKIEFILKQLKEGKKYDEALKLWNASGKAKVISQLKLTETLQGALTGKPITEGLKSRDAALATAIVSGLGDTLPQQAPKSSNALQHYQADGVTLKPDVKRRLKAFQKFMGQVGDFDSLAQLEKAIRDGRSKKRYKVKGPVKKAYDDIAALPSELLEGSAKTEFEKFKKAVEDGLANTGTPAPPPAPPPTPPPAPRPTTPPPAPTPQERNHLSKPQPNEKSFPHVKAQKNQDTDYTYEAEDQVGSGNADIREVINTAANRITYAQAEALNLIKLGAGDDVSAKLTPQDRIVVLKKAAKAEPILGHEAEFFIRDILLSLGEDAEVDNRIAAERQAYKSTLKDVDPSILEQVTNLHVTPDPRDGEGTMRKVANTKDNFNEALSNELFKKVLVVLLSNTMLGQQGTQELQTDPEFMSSQNTQPDDVAPNHHIFMDQILTEFMSEKDGANIIGGLATALADRARGVTITGRPFDIIRNLYYNLLGDASVPVVNQYDEFFNEAMEKYAKAFPRWEDARRPLLDRRVIASPFVGGPTTPTATDEDTDPDTDPDDDPADDADAPRVPTPEPQPNPAGPPNPAGSADGTAPSDKAPLKQLNVPVGPPVAAFTQDDVDEFAKKGELLRDHVRKHEVLRNNLILDEVEKQEGYSKFEGKTEMAKSNPYHPEHKATSNVLGGKGVAGEITKDAYISDEYVPETAAGKRFVEERANASIANTASMAGFIRIFADKGPLVAMESFLKYGLASPVEFPFKRTRLPKPALINQETTSWSADKRKYIDGEKPKPSDEFIRTVDEAYSLIKRNLVNAYDDDNKGKEIEGLDADGNFIFGKVKKEKKKKGMTAEQAQKDIEDVLENLPKLEEKLEKDVEKAKAKIVKTFELDADEDVDDEVATFFTDEVEFRDGEFLYDGKDLIVYPAEEGEGNQNQVGEAIYAIMTISTVLDKIDEFITTYEVGQEPEDFYDNPDTVTDAARTYDKYFGSSVYSDRKKNAEPRDKKKLINKLELYSIKNAIGNFAQKVKKDAIKYNKAKEVLGGPQAAGAAGSGLVGAGLFDETNDTSNNMTFDEDDLEGGRLVDKLKRAGDKIARTAQLVPLPLNAIATGVGAVKGRKARSQNQIDDTDRVFLDASEGAYTNPTQRKSLGPFNYIGGSKENALYIDPKTRKGIIAFRGSTMGKDAYDDWIRSDARGIARGRLQDEPRWKRTEKYLNAILGNYPNISFVFTGHSLGGALAILAAKTYDLPAVTFNAGHGLNTSGKENVKYYHARGDVVSLNGLGKYKDSVMINNTAGNTGSSHLLTAFKGADEGGFSRGNTAHQSESGGSLSHLDDIRNSVKNMISSGVYDSRRDDALKGLQALADNYIQRRVGKHERQALNRVATLHRYNVMAHQARNRKSIRGNHFLLHTIRAKRNLENLEEGGGLYSKIFGKSHKEEYSGQEGLAEMDEINRYNMEEAILPRLARKLTKKLVNKLLKRGGSFTPEEHLEVKRRTGFHINEIRHKIQRHYAN